MGDIRFRCPACGAKHKADEALAGNIASCFECKAEITIPPASTLPPPKGIPIPSVRPPADDSNLKQLEAKIVERDMAVAEMTRRVDTLAREKAALADNLKTNEVAWERLKNERDAVATESMKASANLMERVKLLEKSNAELSRASGVLSGDLKKSLTELEKTRAERDAATQAAETNAAKSATVLTERIKALEATNAELAGAATSSAKRDDEAGALRIALVHQKAEMDGMAARVAEASKMRDDLKERSARLTADFRALHEENQRVAAENKRLSDEVARARVELEKTPIAQPEAVADRAIPALPPNRQVEDLKRQYAALTFDLKARAEELVRIRAERDQALALARNGGDGAASQIAERMTALNARVESLERIRADNERRVLEFRRKTEELTRENNSLNARLRTFAQALRFKP